MKEFVEKLIERLEEELRPDKECFEYEDDYMYAEERHNKMLKIVNQLAGEHNNGWIPCSERLPDDFMSMEYLTTVKGRFYSEINYYCVVNHKWYSNERTTKEVNVIAWMPKPTVYQPKGE